MKIQIGTMALFASLALSCSDSTTSTPPDTGEESSLSATAPTVGTPVQLLGDQSNLCLDVEGGSKTAGAKLQIYACHNFSNQKFTFTAQKELSVYDPKLCVEPTGKSEASRTRLVTAKCDGSAIQKWVWNANGTVINEKTKQCLDVHGQETASKTGVEMATCQGLANQSWTVLQADKEDPAAPNNPHFRDLTCNSVTFAWDAATDNVGVSFYDIYHDGQLMKTVSGAETFTSLTMVPGVPWGIYVNARDAAGNVSQASDTIMVSPPPCEVDTEAPSQPQDLKGTVTGTSVSLSWAESKDNLSVNGYNIYREKTKVGSTRGTASIPPARTFIDSGVPAGTYNYTVEAVDSQDNVSPRSAAFKATISGTCTKGICSVKEITTEKDLPWGLVSLPDGTILYARRDLGDVVRLDPSNGKKTVMGKVPDVQGTDGEGGLMGLEIASTFATDRWLYIMHTTKDDNRVVRMKLTADYKLDIASKQILLKGIRRNKYHNGGRLRWGPDNKLYASTGDAQNPDFAQQLNNLSGKILRMNPDGTIPSDNPFPNSLVWSYGHRNPQGIAFDAKGRLWEQEFGDVTMDETNLIVKGGNYGYPACEGTLSKSGEGCATPGFIAPKRTYPTSEGSCSGITIVREILYVACGRGERLYRAVIKGDSLTEVEQYLKGTYGRLRTVEPTRDGNLWLATTNGGDKDSVPNNSDNRILKLTLSK